MQPEDLESTRRQLSSWQVEPPRDPELRDKVLRQIRSAQASPPEAPSFSTWVQQLWRHPLYAGGLAVLLIMVGMTATFLSHAPDANPEHLNTPTEYRLAIDPLYRLSEAAAMTDRNASLTTDSMDDSLRWLQQELGLTREQYGKLEVLHREFSPTFSSLLTGLQSRLDEVHHLEVMRRQSETIDFMHVYRVNEDYRDLQAQSTSSTAELVARVSEVVTPEQNQRYRELLQLKIEQASPSDDRDSPQV
ncbi:hypothetical protein N9023_03910 [Opitutaceae bacterium]|nr:hypothetical protein [Opitutaceae bacterium]MDB4474128.1 hypothetical protein [Opitutaceae bacterium]